MALVLGTSLSLYPDKFKKRVFTAVQVAHQGRVDSVIFSGQSDSETQDVNQAEDAKSMAISFGLDKEKIFTVGGVNTQENIELARDLLISKEEKPSNVFVISTGSHLIRALPLADHIFSTVNVQAHPLAVFNESPIDVNDPKIIEETIKLVLYNRVLNKIDGEVDSQSRRRIDSIASSYTQLTRSMPKLPELPFEQWRKIVEDTSAST